MLSFAVSMVRVFLTHTDFFGVPKPTQVPEGARDSSNSDYWALPQVRTGDMIYSEEIQASETSPSSRTFQSVDNINNQDYLWSAYSRPGAGQGTV